MYDVFTSSKFASVSPAAFGCNSIRWIWSSPIVVQDPRTGNYTVTFHFSHGNPGGTYICFVRDLERCPVWRQEVSCEQLTNITFTGLLPGVWFSCGVRCSQGGIQRQITRSFPTPLVPTDCDPRLINDGISFVNYIINGDATTCFEWASSGSATEFECRIDSGMPFSCKCMYACMQAGGQVFLGPGQVGRCMRV